jgi:hypothetical protein
LNIRRSLPAFGAALAILAVSALADATPPSQTGIHLVNYTLSIDPDSTDRVRISLPAALEFEEDAPISRGTRSRETGEASESDYPDCYPDALPISCAPLPSNDLYAVLPRP